MFGYIILGSTNVGSVCFGSFLLLGWSMMGFPHKCINHGWCGSAICEDCENLADKKSL